MRNHRLSKITSMNCWFIVLVSILGAVAFGCSCPRSGMSQRPFMLADEEHEYVMVATNQIRATESALPFPDEPQQSIARESANAAAMLDDLEQAGTNVARRSLQPRQTRPQRLPSEPVKAEPAGGRGTP